jgi:hypothetical protein
MPCAPKSMVCWIDFFIARRKLIRRSIWRATFSATSWASSSGVLISWMSILTDLPPDMVSMVLGHVLDLRALAADDDAGAGRVDGHADAVPGALDDDLRPRRRDAACPSHKRGS